MSREELHELSNLLMEAWMILERVHLSMRSGETEQEKKRSDNVGKAIQKLRESSAMLKKFAENEHGANNR